ncbi:MAG: 2OG-Fe(II) oxygenase [Pseudanabaenaceae cyanobacterium bins.68]|nr:2OG-Fe(II) oxygenase [Pseudanabaenaceae cyanobacterium bins.68]
MPDLQELLTQLDLIQHIAQAGYWLSTPELCRLLKFDPAMVDTLNQQPLNFKFVWRNFLITYISQQGNSQCWQIQNQANLHLASPIAQAPSQIASPILPSTCAQIEQFLPAALAAEIYQYALGREADFVSTSTSNSKVDYRQSLFLPHFPEYAELIQERVRATVPDLLQHLQLDPFEIDYIEAQLTSHNHGNYYKVHNDNGSSDTASRELTYVYYFYREPKAFSGGELVIYDSKIENNFYVAAETSQQIQPLNNSIVFFLSRYLHEVLPVTCPSRAFADSRFTINGWVRRKV